MSSGHGTGIGITDSANNILRMMNRRIEGNRAESPQPHPRPDSANSRLSTGSINYISYNYYITNNSGRVQRRPQSAHPSGRSYKARLHSDNMSSCSAERANWIPPHSGSSTYPSRLRTIASARSVVDRCRSSPLMRGVDKDNISVVRTPHPPKATRQLPADQIYRRQDSKKKVQSEQQNQYEGGLSKSKQAIPFTATAISK
eukprot:TRINITY_DN37361_c0_g1_i1.p1 TRINITY_DN37361_c0_g1~~TRINITY_DN37361_c0_g1_i1.p1  ORF type:complete len:201 (+),score=21.87 TRINITY_DN37361_c0_g1_i1:341-943(+)